MSSRRVFIKGIIGAGAAAATRPMAPLAIGAQGRGRLTGLDHVAVPMRNTEAMVAFYRTLGFQVRESAAICSVHMGDHKINFHRPSLWQRKTFSLRASGATPPCGDFCFVWEGNVSSLRAMLDRVDAAVIEGPVDRPGARAGGTVGGTSLYVRDPDQNLLEFITYERA